MGYTKGEWVVKKFGGAPAVFAHPTDERLGDNMIANCNIASKTDSENIANARLIAQAPAMFEVLKDIYEGIGKGQEIIGSGRFEKLAAVLSEIDKGGE